MEELIIDPEIQSKIPALTEDEFKQLEENILEEGQILMPIICWNDIIIDGHNRYKIAQEHPEIPPFQVKRLSFNDKYEAIVWMCHNQLGRRNLTPESRKILIGTAYEAQKMIHGGDHGYKRNESGQFTPSSENRNLGKTRDAIMDQFDAGVYEVNNSVEITRGVDKAEEISPGFRDSYTSGSLKAPEYTIANIPRVPEEIQPTLVKAIEEGNSEEAKKIVREALPERFSKPKKTEKPKESFFKEPDGKFDVEDFSKELQIIVESMDDDFNRYFVREYADMLAQEDGRKAAYDALKKGREVIETYTEVVDSYNE